jgi:aromatic-amino-acid transaminase
MEFLIPSRTARPGDDPIFALNSEARARAQAGEPIVNATVGALLDDEGKLAVMGSVVQAMREVPPEVAAGYAPIAGPNDFLRAVTDDLFGGREAAKHATAVATPGGSGALRHAIANFLELNQTLLTTSFYWGPYKTLADETDRSLGTFRMFDEAGRLDTVDFDRKLRGVLDAQGRALVFLNSPCHNPTGYSFDDNEWRDLMDVAAKASSRGPISIVLDIAYAHYASTPLSALVDRVLPVSDRVQLLFAWTASKAFTQYGARVGALVAIQPDDAERRRIHNALSFSCRGTWSNCNALGMAGVTRALTSPELRPRVDKERAALKALLDRRVAKWNELASSKLKYPRYSGGFFVTVFCDDGPAAAQRLKADGVFVVPQPGALRVALCSVAERDIPRLVDGIIKHTT